MKAAGLFVRCTVGVAILASCASGSHRRPAVAFGTYEFIASNGKGRELRGRLVFHEETIALVPEQGRCWIDPMYPRGERIQFRCDENIEVEDFAILVDRHNPVSSSHWQGKVTQEQTESICVQYETVDGRRTCVKFDTRTYEMKVTTSRPITVKPFATS